MRIVILGAGFGGLELASLLSAEFGPDAGVVLIDKADGFVFGFSKLDVMFGRTTAEHVLHRYADVVKPGVRFVRTEIRSIDPVARRVMTDAETFDADILVVALGADLDPAATPGLAEGGHEFYTLAGAFGLRDVLARFAGGRVVVGVTSTPFKCPPAPSETALLMHDYLHDHGLADGSQVSLVMPLGVPIPPSPKASQVLLAAFAERGINWYPERLVRALDPERKAALLSDGSELPYDLFLGVPVHRAPDVVIQAGMTVDGWIPVNPETLETGYPDVYAVGDVTSAGTPKAGVFAEGQAAVVAQQIAARLRGAGPPAGYDGRGICYLEVGRGMIAKVDVTFVSGQSPAGDLDGPSPGLVADKTAFGSDRSHGGKPGAENSALYGTWNAGKLGLTVDLSTAAGREIVEDLIGWCDVVAEAFSPGLMGRWGLDYDTLKSRNPGLIMISSSIMGQTGPTARLAGYGNVGAALSGYQAITGWPDEPPIGPFGPYTDYVGPRAALAVLLAALDRRHRTGEGCYIDVSQVEAGVFFQSAELADYFAQGTIAPRMGNADREMAPHGVYECQPDESGSRYVTIAVRDDSDWQRLTAALGRSDLAADTDLQTAAGRQARAAGLDVMITAWTRKLTAEHAQQVLQDIGVPAHVSASSRDFCTDPQLAHRGHLVELPHPLFGTTTVEGPRYLLSETPGQVRRAAPTLGQDNEYVLSQILGYDAGRIAKLQDAGVLT